MTDTTDPRVGAGIDALPRSQYAFCREVRQLVHAADPQVTETIKRAAAPASSWRAAFLYDGGIVPGSEGIITGGHASKTGRTVAIRYGEAVTAPALIAMFRLIIANDRVGGWRELKRQADPR